VGSTGGSTANRVGLRAIRRERNRARALERSNRNNSWAVISALFAGMFDDHTIEWLNKRGYLRWDQRGQGEAIIAAVND
jgi:hypothetical protein